MASATEHSLATGPNQEAQSKLLEVLALRARAGVLAGELKINDKRSPKNAERMIGYVSKATKLVPELTVKEVGAIDHNSKINSCVDVASCCAGSMSEQI